MHLSLEVMVLHFAPVHFVVCDALSLSIRHALKLLFHRTFLKLKREARSHFTPKPFLRLPSVMLLHVEKSNSCRYYYWVWGGTCLALPGA